MIIVPIDLASARYVSHRMRQSDVDEIFACRWDDDRDALAADAAARTRFGWAAGKDGEPIACIGVIEVWPGVWESWMFATDKFRIVGKGLTKFALRTIIPAAKSAGAHRLQCHSMEGHVVAHRWLEGLGAKREATHPGYGRGGETFHTYAMDFR